MHESNVKPDTALRGLNALLECRSIITEFGNMSGCVIHRKWTYGSQGSRLSIHIQVEQWSTFHTIMNWHPLNMCVNVAGLMANMLNMKHCWVAEYSMHIYFPQENAKFGAMG